MQKLILIGLLALGAMHLTMPSIARADLEGAPFIPEIDKRFDAIEQGNHYLQGKYPSGSFDGHQVQQQVVATYDYSKLGGASTVPIDLGQSLPKNAIITQVGAWTLIPPNSLGGSTTLGFYCQNLGNLFSTLTLASAYSTVSAMAGIENATIANWSTVTAKCDVMAKIGVGTLNAGKITLFIEYVVHQ